MTGPDERADAMDDPLRGVFDLHVHTAPDLVPRVVNDFEMARRAALSGMAGFVIKSHHAPTADRATLCAAAVQGARVVGSITLNHYVGGLNALAVEAAARSGARVVWLPTTDAINEADVLMNWPPDEPLPPYLQVKKDLLDRGLLPPPIAVTGDDGALTTSAMEVLEVVRDHGLTLCTGHLGWPEIAALIPAARQAGVEKLVVTHPESPSIGLSASQQSWLAGLGAYFERCYAYSDSRQVIDQEASAVRLTGVSRNVLSSDLGRLGSPFPDEGMGLYIREFERRGFSERELRQMTAATPSDLVA
jgi:hypothetical protein